MNIVSIRTRWLSLRAAVPYVSLNVTGVVYVFLHTMQSTSTFSRDEPVFLSIFDPDALSIKFAVCSEKGVQMFNVTSGGLVC